MTERDIKKEQESQKKVIDFLRGLADAEERYNDPKTRNNLFKKHVVPPPLKDLSVFSAEWLKQNRDLAKSNGYRYPLTLTAPPKPWEWQGVREQEGLVIESSRESSRKRSSTQTELVGQRVHKRAVIPSEPHSIFAKGGGRRGDRPS